MSQVVVDQQELFDNAISLVDKTFSSHPQVRRNEAIIWEHLCDQIASTIEYVSSQQPVHILEIGGSSLQGLELLSQKPFFHRIKYTIVDEASPYNVDLINNTRTDYLQMRARDIDYSKVGMVNFVIAVRALEYDPHYSESLELFHRLSSYPAYGIFVHNSEHSKAFDDVKMHQAILNFRLSTLSLARDVSSNNISRESALESAKEWASMQLGTGAEKEFARFSRLLSKIESCAREEIDRQLADKRGFYQAQLIKINGLYAERLSSRRFWADNVLEISDLYASSSLILLERTNAHLRSSGLRVHIDTVDLYNSLKRNRLRGLELFTRECRPHELMLD
jgi:hypothetical protein